MAEKEQRILIKKEINYHPPYGGWRGDGKEIVFKRQEAIEKMANALSLVQAKTFVDEIQWERVMNGCRYEAEAALNALLEGK